MNAQTTATLNNTDCSEKATDKPSLFKIQVASFISEAQEFELRLHFHGNLKMFEFYIKDAEKFKADPLRRYRYLDDAERYKTGALALIDGLKILHAIDEKEYNRLAMLFPEQADLCAEQHAAV